ncbi:MAG: hypothetical protein CMJ58_10760 [Planctomycetaceae bacterium]|nr:hypothetical protein [Planctomycetaceae bacterium]
MRFSLNARDDAPYDRPQQPWRCGLAHDGPACPVGPDGKGRCPGAAACHPVRDGDRWRCNRSPLRGGPCDEGPSPDGACSVAYQCTPWRSLRSRRGRFVWGAVLATAGAVLILLNAEWRAEAIAPGPLSVHHAQLVAGEQSVERCAACHSAGATTAAAWIGHVTFGPPLESLQSTLCMECHDKRLPVEFATAAHTMDPTLLPPAADGSPRRDPADPIACRACHREHQGRLHDLTSIADANCQACHGQRYHGFADDHPELADWPYRRRTAIAFDHGAHQAKHFPEEQREFACTLCHQADATGARMLTLGYDVTCRECHEQQIAASTAAGIAVLTVPTLDVDALTDAGHDVGDWPQDATGDFDGPLTPPVKMLLAGDADGAAALAELGARFDFYDIEFDDERQLAAAAQAIAAYKRTLGKLAAGDEAAAARFPGLALATMRSWLDENLPDAAGVAATREGEAPAEPEAATRIGSAGASPSPPNGPIGRWESDATTRALKYYPAGHADAALRTWLDALAAAATGPHAAVADPLLRDLAKPTAPGECALCHSLDHADSGEYVMQWRALSDESPNAEATPAALTRFAHGPHLTQPQLEDCSACHRIAEGADVMTAYAHDDPRAFTPGFAALQKTDCASCHRPEAAGDNCTQCHQYHP